MEAFSTQTQIPKDTIAEAAVVCPLCREGGHVLRESTVGPGPARFFCSRRGSCIASVDVSKINNPEEIGRLVSLEAERSYLDGLRPVSRGLGSHYERP